jgi:hypothetical protein
MVLAATGLSPASQAALTHARDELVSGLCIHLITFDGFIYQVRRTGRPCPGFRDHPDSLRAKLCDKYSEEPVHECEKVQELAAAERMGPLESDAKPY